MPRSFDWRVLPAAALLALLLGALNNALSAHPAAWIGSPELIPNPLDLAIEPHATGAIKGVRFFWKELGRLALPVAIGAAVVPAMSIVWRKTRRPSWAQIADSWLRFALAAIFLDACWFKLQNPAEFATAVAQYRMLPPALVGLFSVWMPALEAIAALGLLCTRWSRELYLLLTVLWAMFIIALAQALYRRLGIACGCFAIEGVAASVAETWFSLERDLVLIVPTAWFAAKAQRRFFWEDTAPL